MKNFDSAKLTITILTTSLFADCVAAQMLEEVVVTAQRRAQSLQEVPLSVSAISGDDVGVGKVEGMGDIANATPNVVFSSFNVGEPRIYIRGIGSSSDSAASDPAVGMFIDEVYIGRTGGSGTELFDLERVEILRGPQSTLYGKNTNGGAINFISARPQQDFAAKVSATVGDYNLWSLRGLVNGGITDTVSAKLTMSVRQRDGYGKNVITPGEVVNNGDFSGSTLIGGSIGAGDGGEELDDAENFNIRSQMLLQPTDQLDVLLGVDYSKDETNGICRHLQNLDAAAGPLPALWAINMSAAYNSDERHCASQFDVSQEKTVTGVLGRVDYNADIGTLTSITAWRSSDYNFVDDLTSLPLTDPAGFAVTPENVIDGVDEEASQFSQEFRFKADGETLSWLGGLFYMREEVERDEEFYTHYSAAIRTQLPLAGIGDVLFTQDNTTTSMAAFGQVDWHINDAWTLTYGVRWSSDEKDIKQASTDLLGGNVPPTGVPLIVPGFAEVGADETWSEVTHKLATNYHFTENVMGYALYAEGFKSGAFESQTNTVAAAQQPVDPEFVTNYEAGIKTEWWDNRMQFNLSYFFMDYEDLQVFQLNTQLLLRLLNAQAESEGWEASFVILPSEGLRVSIDYSNNETEYTEFIDANGNDQSGNSLIRAPEHSVAANIDYVLALSGGSSLNFNVAYNWKDDYFQSPTNAEKSTQEAVAMVDANISWVSSDEAWNVTAWGKNLKDETVIASLITDPTGITSESYVAPRTYGLTVTRNWF